jgi:DNA-binding IclR family transcriptional regulator
LLEDLRLCKQRGYALDREEFFDGMVAAAVPVTDQAGRFIAALAVHGPKQRISIDRAIGYVGCLRKAAVRLQDAVLS